MARCKTEGCDREQEIADRCQVCHHAYFDGWMGHSAHKAKGAKEAKVAMEAV